MTYSKLYLHDPIPLPDAPNDDAIDWRKTITGTIEKEGSTYLVKGDTRTLEVPESNVRCAVRVEPKPVKPKGKK